MTEQAQKFTVEKIMTSIHYFRCTSCVELVSLVLQLPQYITDKCENNVGILLVGVSTVRHTVSLCAVVN